MEPYDIVGQQKVTMPVGEVDVSVALHPGGSISVVATLVATGQRVGWLRSGTWVRLPQAIAVNNAVVGPELVPAMRRVMVEAVEHLPCSPLVGRTCVHTSAIREDALRALRGYQWLLDELGEHYELDELAAGTGLLQGSDQIIAHVPGGEPAPSSAPAIVSVPAAPWTGEASQGPALV